MKKILKMLFIVVIGFMLVPMVNAKNLPESGVTYFMHYPDGSEKTTTTYSEAANPQEALIYSGVTDENGNVPLCNWDSSGQLRVVQHVPNGYTTNEKEMVINLSDMSKATFIDYRGLANPKTGRSLLVLLGIIGVVSVTILVSKKNKKSLLVIPVVAALAVITTVEAEGSCPCIKIKDGLGKPLAGVKVDIYAKPTNIDAAPAIKFDANGGQFFDGTTEMYLRLPSSPCTINELMSSLGSEGVDHFQKNIMYAYRDQYRLSLVDDETDTLVNGQVIKLQWTQDSNANLVVIKGNGGKFNQYGFDLDEITTYYGPQVKEIASAFTYDDYYNIGIDNNASCSNYNSYGLLKEPTGRSVIKTYYVCWNNKPDGIYVNGILFQGTDETCFAEGQMDPKNETSFNLYSKDGHRLTISDIGNEDINFSLSNYSSKSPKFDPYSNVPIKGTQSAADVSAEITSIEVVKDGRTVAKYLAGDLEEDGVYYILNDDTIYDIIDYMQGFIENNCLNTNPGN